jgi:hypothetical protein
MPDVFSNLAAQSLSSRVGIQPLIPPLFAPAPQLVSDTAPLPASNDQAAVAAENAPFSIPPSIFANKMTGMLEMEPPSEEVASPEKRTILPDLVPPDVPQNTVSILPLRHLLQPQHLAHDEMGSVSPTSQPSEPVPTIDESSYEDTYSLAFPQDGSVGASAELAERLSIPSRPSPIDQPRLPVPTQEATAPDAVPETTGIPPFFVRNEDQKQTGENSFQAAPTKPEPQHVLPKDHPVGARFIAPATGDASRLQNVSPIADKPVAPAPLPSSQPLVQSEHIVNRDDVPVGTRFIAPPADTPEAQQAAAERKEGRRDLRGASFNTLAPTADKSAPIEPLLDQPALAKESNPRASQPAQGPSNAMQPVEAGFMAPPVIVPAQNMFPSMTPRAGQETPGSVANLKDAHSQEIAAERQGEGPSGESFNNLAPTADKSARHQPAAQDALHLPRVSSKQKAAVAKEEGELPSIRITIGRVVVRATLAAQPTPIQKRVLRPAQSLSEYLKQRERGNR